MRIKLSLAAIVLLLNPAALAAQILFSQANVTSAIQAQGFEYKLYQTLPNSSTSTVFVLTSVTCSSFAGGTANCTAPTPLAANKSTGVRFDLTARDVQGGTPESVRSLPFFFPAVAPTSLSITP